MKRTIILMLLLALGSMAVHAQTNDSFLLGNGLLLFETTIGNPPHSVSLYKDSSLTAVITLLTPEQTNCPICMLCAEPEEYYQGPLRPITCGGNEMAFICTQTTSRFHQIIADSIGTRFYLPAKQGKYYTWDQYMKWRASLGDYYVFYRPDNQTILYDKRYALDSLPAADKNFEVGLHYKHVNDYRFYPVAVQGYWMKLKVKNNKKTIGYCWVIWRNETSLLIGFKFRTD